MLGFHSIANKKKSVNFLCLTPPLKWPNKNENLSSPRNRLWGTLGSLWVGLVSRSMRCEQGRMRRHHMLHRTPCPSGRNKEKKKRKEQAVVAISKLWNRITVLPSFLLLLISSAGNPHFIPVRCEDLATAGNHAWKMFLDFLSLDKVNTSCKVILLLHFVGVS